MSLHRRRGSGQGVRTSLSRGEGVLALSIEVMIDKEKDLVTRTLTGQIPIEEIIASLKGTVEHPD